MKYLLSVILASFIFFLIGCTEKVKEQPTEPDPTVNTASCVGCHTNYEHLKAIHTPDPPDPGGGGCGGDAPHIEPYDRVYLGGSGYEAFKNDIHGKMPCVSCHNGVDNTDNKNQAHSGNFISKPSENSTAACGSCHPNIVNRTKNSIHEQGWGQKNMVTQRSGLGNVPHAFDNLSDMMKEGYNHNCATCHATCGDCHVNRPAGGGGGLYKGHQFSRTPDMRDNCVACHSSRGGHAYFGIGAGTQPDVHNTQAGFTCVSCHTANEIHGDGQIYDQRYKVAGLPQCQKCHSDISNSNSFHSVHLSTFSCYTCHSQDYNNCGSCHIGGSGARIPAYLGYKIGINPISDTKPYRLSILRRSPMAPDSWELFGTSTLSNFDIKPTYKYTTPHNILRWTSRTQVSAGKSCYDNCHIIFEDNTYRNRELYLFSSDLLEPWEITANQGVIVDNKLPVSWGTP